MAKNFQPLKQQARALSFVGCAIRGVIIFSILFAIGTVGYISAVGLVWPWDTETGKAFIDDIKARAGITTPPADTSSDTDSAPDDASANANPSDANDSQLNVLTKQLKTATAERDRLERKVKSAKSFLSDAQTKIDRAEAEWNSANANYTARANSPVQSRGKTDALARIQQDIDRADRHRGEAKDYYEQKKAVVDTAQKELDASNQRREQIKADLARARQ